MMCVHFIAQVALSLFLTTTVHGATTTDVVAANVALTSQIERTDFAVVAITAQTPPTSAQQYPSALQSLTNAIATAQTSLTPASPSTDPAIEEMVTETWALLANNAEELMDDYVEYRPYLIDSFGLKSAFHAQLLTFNSTFLDYAAFMITVVDDPASKARIQTNTKATIGILNNPPDGITEAFKYYT